jgi:hypothetical protein
MACLLLAVVITGCKTLNGGANRELEDMPGMKNNFLAAKVAAFRHAMERMPPESKRYGDEFYTVAGIQDPDPAHVQVLLLALADMHPPVTEASKLYTREGNSKWFGGKPAIVWTSKVQRVTEEVHVFVLLGWMHSNLLYEFFEYEVRYNKREDSWEIVDYKSVGQQGG